MALHATANEFFALLSTSAPPPDLSTLNIEAVERARAEKEDRMDKMAVAVENDLPVNQQWNRLGWAAAAVDFENQQNKLVVRLDHDLLKSISVLLMVLYAFDRAVTRSLNRISHSRDVL